MYSQSIALKQFHSISLSPPPPPLFLSSSFPKFNNYKCIKYRGHYFYYDISLTVTGFFVLVGYIARKIYAAKRETAAAISIQKYIRMWLVRHAYFKLYFSAIIIQSHVRGFVTRQRLLHGKEHRAATFIQVILARYALYVVELLAGQKHGFLVFITLIKLTSFFICHPSYQIILNCIRNFESLHIYL